MDDGELAPTTEARADAAAYDAAPMDAARAGRRSALRRFGLQAAGAAAAVTAGLAAATVPAAAQSLSDSDYLNFVLNLEYLQAECYLRAVTGSGLPAGDVTGTGGQGLVSGGGQVRFVSKAIATYAQVLAVDELAHVQFLREVLGSGAVAEPNIDFGASFTNFAVAAGLIVSGQTFNAFENDVSFLLAAYTFEDLVVTAYAGVARYLSAQGNLEVLGALMATESYHAGAVRTLVANIGGGAAGNLISNERAALSGQSDDQGVIIAGNNYNFATGDANSLAYRRTLAQVLSVVYGGPSTGGGLFFPTGLSGNIR